MAQTTKKKTTQQSGRRSASPSTPTPQASNPAMRTAGGVLCLLLALCVAVSYFNAQAVLLGLLRSALTGLFGYGYWLWAAMLLVSGLFLLLHRERKATAPALCALLTPALCGSLLHLIFAAPVKSLTLSALWAEGQTLHGGGVICGGLAELGKAYISEAVFAILAAVGLVACVFVMLHTTPSQVAEKARQRAAQRAEEAGSDSSEPEQPPQPTAPEPVTPPLWTTPPPRQRTGPSSPARSPSLPVVRPPPRTRC